MAGSFVPTQPRFEAGVARMDLPPEARVLRDRHWVCLVHAGEHLALCRGELPQDDAGSGPQIALTGGPAEPRPGEMLTIAGVVLNPGRTPHNSAALAWQLEIRSVLDQVLATLPLEPSPAGMFSVEMTVPESWSGEHLRFTVRRGQRVVENLAPRLTIQVARAGREEFVVCSETQPHWPPEADNVTAHIAAWFPWGIPAGLGQLIGIVRGVRLPDETNGYRPLGSGGLEMPGPHGRPEVIVRPGGWFDFPIPIDVLQLPPGPAALGLWTSFGTANGEQTGIVSEMLQAAGPVHAWLVSEPSEPVTGQPLRLRLGWFDPNGRTGLKAAHAVIRRAGQPIADLDFEPQPDGGQSARWQPPEGAYEVE